MFFADDTCLDYYRTLGLYSSATAVNDAATAICASQMCRNRMKSYTDYLLTCRVGNFYNDDDDNDDVCHCMHNVANYVLVYIFNINTQITYI